jgi:hypothetical protein
VKRRQWFVPSFAADLGDKMGQVDAGMGAWPTLKPRATKALGAVWHVAADNQNRTKWRLPG